MIEVRMRHHDGIDGLRRNGKRLPIALAKFLQTLKKTAIDENPVTTCIQEVLRAGDRTRGSEEGQ